MSNTRPYETLVGQLRLRGYRVHRFDLDGDRWIYELVAPDERRSGKLSRIRMRTGLHLGGKNPVYERVFSRDDQVMLQVEFEETRAAVMFYTKWLSPEGDLYSTKPIAILPGETGFVTYLRLDPGQWLVGHWEVSAISQGQRPKILSFEIR